MRAYLKRIAKKIANICGLEISRKLPPPVKRISLAGFLEHISHLGFQPQTVIDVGVAIGTNDLYEYFPKAKFLLIEPLEEFEPYLKDIAHRYDAEYILAAAGPSEGTVTISVHPDLFGSSIFKEAEGEHVDGFSRQVPVVAIDALCEEKQLDGPYLIKIDTQGSELYALDGAHRTLEDTEVVILEVSLFQFLIHAPQFHEVIAYMKTRGFVLYDVTGTCYRLFDGALAQLDLAFVKEQGFFKKSNFYATKEQREWLTGELLSQLKKQA